MACGDASTVLMNGSRVLPRRTVTKEKKTRKVRGMKGVIWGFGLADAGLVIEGNCSCSASAAGSVVEIGYLCAASAAKMRKK